MSHFILRIKRGEVWASRNFHSQGRLLQHLRNLSSKYGQRRSNEVIYNIIIKYDNNKNKNKLN